MKRKEKTLYAILVSFLLCFFVLVISSCEETTASSFSLSSSELSRLKLEAVRGAGEAAQRVVDYYLLTKSDYNNQFIWTIIGAENGDRYTMDMLGGFYAGGFRTIHENFTRYIFWLYQLAMNNYESTTGYWRSETFIKRLESNGYTLETAKPPSDSLYPDITLDPNSTTRYQEGALQGSGQAALVLANHYNKASEAEEAEDWYRIGAQNGNNECMQQYGNILLGKKEMLDRERGKFWLARLE